MIGGLFFLAINNEEVVILFWDESILYFTINKSILVWVKDCCILNYNSFVSNNDMFFNVCQKSCKPHFEFIYKDYDFPHSINLNLLESYRVLFSKSFWYLFSVDLNC